MFYFAQNYYIFYGTGREPLVNFGFTAMLTCMVAIGLAVGVTVAVGGLLFIQVLHTDIRKHTTGLKWIPNHIVIMNGLFLLTTVKIETRDAPIRHWPIIGRPIISA